MLTASDGSPAGEVLVRFAAEGPPERLPGGRGMAWRAGAVVLTPVDDAVSARWVAALFDRLSGPGFRVPRPRRASGGDWVVGGWAAWEHVDGEPGVVAHWAEFVRACRGFHASLRGVEPPPWLAGRDDPWAIADRVAWGEERVAVAAPLRGQVEALTGALRPVDLPVQLVHGDMGGNVLFAPGELPAVIDFAAYLRPAGYALAIAAVDALAWSAAPPSILDELAGEPEIDQLLARALVYRLVTESLARSDRPTLDAVARAGQPVVELVLARLAGKPPGGAYVTDADLARLVADRRENLCRHRGRLMLVDWAAAAVGNPWFDVHAWLVNLGAEGGPRPEARQGPGAAGHAAWIAGHNTLLAPSRDSAPAPFDLRRRRVAVAIAWAARLLGLPPVNG